MKHKTINELSSGKLQGYIKSAKADALKTINAPVDLSNRSNNDPKAWGRIVKRTKGVDLAKRKIVKESIDDLFYSLLDEMKMGDACATMLNDEYFTESEQEDMFGELLIPTAILAFAEHYNSVDDPDGEDIQNFFDAFLAFEHIPESFGNVIAQTINELAQEDNDDDDDVGVMSVGDWDKLSNQERILKVKAFLKAIYSSGDNFRDIKPFISRGPGPDSYGNEFGKNVKVFDRKANRYGHTDNPTTPKGTNAYLQRKPLPNLPITENLLDVGSASKIERYARWMNNNKTFLNSGMDTAMESPTESLKAAGLLKDEHDKKCSNGDAEYDPSDFIFGRTTKGRFK